MNDLRVTISRKTAFKVASKRFRETNFPQAVYVKDDGQYATMNKRAWWMMKPGRLVCVMMKLDHKFSNGRKRRWTPITD